MPIERHESELAEGLRVAIAAGGGEPLYGGESGITLASRLEWFFGAALREHEEWSRYAGVDQLDCSLQVVDEVTVEAAGLLTWFHGRESFVDPAWARIRLSRTLPHVESYEVRIGDASSGVGAVPSGAEPPTEWPAVRDSQLIVGGVGYPGST